MSRTSKCLKCTCLGLVSEVKSKAKAWRYIKADSVLQNWTIHSFLKLCYVSAQFLYLFYYSNTHKHCGIGILLSDFSFYFLSNNIKYTKIALMSSSYSTVFWLSLYLSYKACFYLTLIYTYKVEIFACLSVRLYYHNSGTPRPICLKFLLGNSGDSREFS